MFLSTTDWVLKIVGSLKVSGCRETLGLHQWIPMINLGFWWNDALAALRLINCDNLSSRHVCFLPADICIATAISLLMILICGMATYGAYKVNKWTTKTKTENIQTFFTNHVPLFASPIRATQQHAAWIIPFFCYQIFDFALNTLVAISVVVYPNTVQDYLQQLVRIPPTHTSFIMSNAPVVNFLGDTDFIWLMASSFFPARDIPLQRGHHVHQQHVPSFRRPPLHWVHPVLQGESSVRTDPCRFTDDKVLCFEVWDKRYTSNV